MKPTNQKHLYHILSEAIDGTISGDLKVAQAREVSNLGARMNTIMKIEHDRVRVMIELEAHKAAHPDTKAELRNPEGKNFD
jgi:hypothetical protein